MIATVMALVILITGMVRRVDVYAAFVKGAQEGLQTALRIAPCICAALMVTAALQGSGLMQAAESVLRPAMDAMHLPQELLPFLVMRPVSGAGALSVLAELMREEGVDSHAARLAAAMMGSSETVLYVIPVYLGAAKKKTARYVLWAALAAMTAGMAVCTVLVR